MKKQLLLVCLVVAALSAFGQSDSIIPARSEYHFYRKTALQTTETNGRISASVQPGEHIVIVAEERGPDNPGISDDEMVERYAIEVPRFTKKFSAMLSTVPAVYLKGCFCTDRGYYRVTNGYVKGRKLKGNQWRITINLTVNTSEPGITKTYSITRTFTEGQQPHL